MKAVLPLISAGQRTRTRDRDAVAVVADEISRSGVLARAFDQLGGAGSINKLT